MIDEKAVLNLVELAQQSVGYVKFLTEERDVALRECSKWAREAGEATGKLQMSEAAGIVDEWRERAEAAETERDQAIREAAELREAIEDFVHDYRETYKRPATGGVRWDAPKREAVAKLNAAIRPKPEGQG